MSKNLSTIRRSATHLLAAAVKNLFPKTSLGIGPVIQDGFYYDFDSPHKMHLVIACCHGVIRGSISSKYSKLLIFAFRFFRELNGPKTLILTGGYTSPGVRKPEAEAAYEWLKTNNYLPNGRILLENHALDSFENLKNSIRLVSNYDKATAVSYPWKKERFNIMANALHIRNFHFRSPATEPSKIDLANEKEEILEVKNDPLCEGKYFQKIRETHNFNS